MASESAFKTLDLEKFNRRQDSFQEAFQIYEPFELNSAYTSPLLSAQVSQSETLEHDNLKSDSTLFSGTSASSKYMYSAGSIGKANRKRVNVRPNHTPRPPNSFILYRRDKHAEILLQSNTEKGMNNNTISKVVADMWKNESLEVKALYAAKADEEKRKHFLKYPDYKYQPRKNAKKSNPKSYIKPDHDSNSIASAMNTDEAMHQSQFSFDNPFSSPWPSHDTAYDFHSQFSFNHPPPQTFYESRSIKDYTLNQMEPNYHF
jgi:hypothetical protein